jgi:hypothetical protein
MIAALRTATIFLAVTFLALTLAARFVPFQPRPIDPQKDLFDPELARADSLDKAEIWIRARLDGSKATDAQVAEEISTFMRRRFFHDLATFRFSDNWVAYLAGFVWSDLAAPVRPDDLLKYRRGICTQQAMVFQALLQRFDIDYATVGFDRPPHMLVGAKIDGTWMIFDSDKEPHRTRLVPFTEALKGDILAELYRGKPGTPAYGFGNDVGLQWQHAVKKGHIEIKGINSYPAPEGAAFHMLASFLSSYGWLIFGLVAAAAHMPFPALPILQLRSIRASQPASRAVYQIVPTQSADLVFQSPGLRPTLVSGRPIPSIKIAA